MRFAFAQLIASLNEAMTERRKARRRRAFRESKKYAAATTALALLLSSTMILPGITLGVPQAVKKVAVTATPAIPKTTTIAAPTAATQKKALPPVQVKPAPAPAPPSSGGVGSVYYPTSQTIETAKPINFAALAKQEALEPSHDVPTEIKSINAPKGDKPEHHRAINAPNSGATSVGEEPSPNTPPPSATGPSPGPLKTFKGEFLSATTIPPDTHGAVGTNFVVTSSNDRLRIQTRDGVELSRVTINSFWSTATVKGVAVASAFDTKVYYDRFNNHFILVSSLNGPGINSGAGIAVTQTNDPTGTWFRYTVASDPASTATAGHAIDYPSVGFNKNWIVVDENSFNYSGSAFTTYFGQQIFVLDKAAAYANTLSSISLFEGPVSGCVSPFEGQLGCGFTMAPAITEDNTTDTEYMVEDWDSTAAQLRMSKITGTPSTPVITVGTQFPQSTESWRFDARRIGTTGGYVPQRQQAANLPSGTRMMANDSRIQNCVLRGTSLWATHTVMLSTVPQPAGTVVGGTSVGGTLLTRDNHSGVQWWQIDSTIEAPLDAITGLGTPPIQRARIEDATADNCHDGNGGTMTTGPCVSTATQVGTFFAFPNISVNKDNNVLIGFTQFSPLTYPNAAYATRLAADTSNTTRDPAVFRPGQANYNIGAGTGGTTARQNRWGDYSGAQTDPLDDTNFWTVQEYAGTVRDFGIGLAGNWETWWAQVNPTAAAPSTSGNLIISEFRLRGPQGVGDEFVELYNPASTPIIVSTTDNSDGWALASNNGAATVGMAVVPNGTVIPARGRFLIARNPDAANGPTVTYSLNSYPGNQVRGADSDTGYSLDTADTSGIAIFKTATVANFSVATEMDAAGPATLPVGSLFKEGTGFGPLPTTSLQYTMYRNLSGGSPQDTNNNSTDFIFADTNGTFVSGLGQRLGAPGPENLDGPVQRNATMPALLLDQSIVPAGGSSTPPNRVRDLTPDIANNSTFGTISIRRRVVNNTGQTVTKLRFRIVSMTTFPPASVSIADLRVRTSSDTTAGVNDAATCAASSLSAPCTVTVRGTTLDTPPAQPNGGGLNASVSAGAITLAAPLANGASVNVQFLLGVQQTGTFNFFVNIEAAP
jgi:hypothetical protein